MERGDGWGVEDERGALGEATGHEEASAGDCGEFWGGNGEGEVALCMGHPGGGMASELGGGWGASGLGGVAVSAQNHPILTIS